MNTIEQNYYKENKPLHTFVNFEEWWIINVNTVFGLIKARKSYRYAIVFSNLFNNERSCQQCNSKFKKHERVRQKFKRRFTKNTVHTENAKKDNYITLLATWLSLNTLSVESSPSRRSAIA